MNPFHHPDRLSRFVLTFGMADMVIAGVDSRLSLFIFGMITAGVGLLFRWSSQPQQQEASTPSTKRYRERRIY